MRLKIFDPTEPAPDPEFVAEEQMDRACEGLLRDVLGRKEARPANRGLRLVGGREDGRLLLYPGTRDRPTDEIGSAVQQGRPAGRTDPPVPLSVRRPIVSWFGDGRDHLTSPNHETVRVLSSGHHGNRE